MADQVEQNKSSEKNAVQPPTPPKADDARKTDPLPPLKDSAAPAPSKPVSSTQTPAPSKPASSTPATSPIPSSEPKSTEPVATKKVPVVEYIPAKKEEPIAKEATQEAGDNVALTCPVCGLVNRPGELACSRCGTLLATGGTTRKLGTQVEPPRQASWPTGEVIVTDQEPIVFEIGDKQITVPLADMVTVGRSSDIPGEDPPDVDLAAYGASEYGVSRRHIKIKRKNILVYVADLNSTNGTLLNGRKLMPNAERLLRNGDELQLGRLKVKVKF